MTNTTQASALQGWNPDPTGRFEQRYFSAGAMTTLVRNGAVEARDDPTRPLPPEPTEVADVAPESLPAPAAPRYLVYRRRQRRGLARLVLAIAMLTPVVGWEALVSTTNDRVFGAVTFTLIAATVTVVVYAARIPRSAR